MEAQRGMNMEENKMATMPIKKLLLTMATPLILSMLVGALYNIVDSIFVSRYSEDALTAVSLAFPIQNIIVSVGTGLGAGMNAVLSNYLGKKDQENVDKCAHNGLLLGLITYLFLLVFGLFGVRSYYYLQSQDQVINELGIIYLSIVCIGAFGQIFQLLFERLLQSTGKTIYTMYSQISGAVLNIILDPILIFGLFHFPKMGIAGAAIATVLGQIFALCIGLYFNLKANKEIHLSFHALKWNGKIAKKICSVGIPASITMFLSSIMSLGLNWILGSYSSTAIAVFGAYFKTSTFISMATFGLNNAMISIVAFNLGTRNYKRAKETLRLSAIISIGIGVFGLLLLQIFPRQIMNAFGASEYMMSLGLSALRIASFNFPFACLSIMVCYGLQAMAKGMPSMLISCLRQVIFLLPLAYILGKMMGTNGVWLSIVLAEFFAMLVAVVCIKIAMKDCFNH